jgi:hypothetical protein
MVIQRAFEPTALAITVGSAELFQLIALGFGYLGNVVNTNLNAGVLLAKLKKYTTTTIATTNSQ